MLLFVFLPGLLVLIEKKDYDRFNKIYAFHNIVNDRGIFMKKKLVLAGMLFGILFFLVGCVNVDTVKDRFGDAGYTYSEDASVWISALLTEFQENGITVTVHVFTRSLRTAIVLEFESTKAMQEQLEESQTLQGLIADLEEAQLVEGNFLLIPIGLSTDGNNEIIQIFKGDYEPSAKS